MDGIAPLNSTHQLCSLSSNHASYRNYGTTHPSPLESLRHQQLTVVVGMSRPPLPLLCPHCLDRRMGRDVIQVARSRRNGAVRELLRKDADVHAVAAELGGGGVTQTMGVQSLLDPSEASESREE